MLSGQAVRVAVQLVSVVVLARLLTPSDFGLLAMVTAVIGLGAVIRDFGLGQAAVQATSISNVQKSNLFWTNLAIGVLVSGAIAVLSGPIAALYDDQRVSLVALALAPTFVLGAAATQFRAELSRRMRFKAIALSEVVAQVAGVATAIGMSVAGAGYWALVLQQIVDPLILLGLSAALARWMPGLPGRAPMGRFYRFGWGLLGTQTILYVSQNVDSFLVGSRYGAAVAGLYNRAFQLLMLPLNQLAAPSTRVALPVLARLQLDRPAFDRYVVRANLLLAMTIVMGLAFVASQADAVVVLVLGNEWTAAVPIFQILAIAGCFQSLSYSVYWTFLAHGRTVSNLYFTLITRSLLIVGLVAVSGSGVLAIAAMYSIGLALSWPLGLAWVRKWGPSPALAWQGVRVLSYGAIVASVSGLIGGIGLPIGIQLIVALLGVGVAVVALAVISKQFRQDLGKIAHTAKLIRDRGVRS